LSKKRLILFVLGAVAAGLPAWVIKSWTTNQGVLAPDGIKVIFYIIIPIISMGALMIWAVRIADTPAESKKTRWLLFWFGPFGAFYLIFRATAGSHST
jgi:hypothetical protein